MRFILQDIRFALRLLMRQPGFTTVAVVTLALGIGATTALFTVVHAVLVRPLPYPAPERLVAIGASAGTGAPSSALAGSEVEDLRGLTGAFERVGAIVAVGGNLTSAEGDVPMERVTAASATDDFLPTLGVKPALGRLLENGVDSGPQGVRAVLISHELWQRRFGGRPDVLGSDIEVNNAQRTVVGIMPAGFQLLLGADAGIPARIDVWFPTALETDRRSRGYTTIARLAAAASLGSVRARLDALGRRVSAGHPGSYAVRPLAFAAHPLQHVVVREAKRPLLALMGAVGLVLLIACANVANLLFARATTRGHELAVRAALGAGRGRLIAQLLTEGLVLGIAGGAAGVLVAQWTESLVVWLRPSTLPPVDVSALGRGPLAFALLVTLGASLLFSLAPAVQAARQQVTDALKGGSRGGPAPGRGLRSTLVAAEVALSVVLLVGAGLLLRTMAAVGRVETGFDADGVLTLRADLHVREFRTVERKWQFYRAAVQRLRELPGVQAASGIRPLPLEGVQFTDRFVSGETAAAFAADWHTTLPGYFATMGIAVKEGREFDAADVDEQRRVAIVDDLLAARLFPSGRALGRTLRLERRAAGGDDDLEVIGVVRHVRARSLREAGNPQIYFPYHRSALFDMALVVKGSGSPEPLGAAAKRAIEGLGGGRPVHGIAPLERYVAEATRESRFMLVLMSIFAGLALTLSGIGLYGVVSYTTAQRRREIGIRTALGAAPADIVRLVLRDGLGASAAGLTLGLAGAAPISRTLGPLLFGVEPTDAPTLTSVAVLLAAVAAAASYVPARRALRVPAAEALNR